jgi:hypothetical protein
MLLAFAAQPKTLAQYPGYPIPPQYPPPQSPFDPYPAPGMNPQQISGTWFMFGDPQYPCRIIPLPGAGRALFVNEKGDRVEGFIRGSQILVPKWQVQGRYEGNSIQWSNQTMWAR